MAIGSKLNKMQALKTQVEDPNSEGGEFYFHLYQYVIVFLTSHAICGAYLHHSRTLAIRGHSHHVGSHHVG